MHQSIDPSDHGHDRAAGALCTEDGTGCCAVCGVEMSTCYQCGGIGYHRDLCPDSDDTYYFHAARDALAYVLKHDRLWDQHDALTRCDDELLATLRRLGLDGRDDLTNHEIGVLRRAMRPTLIRVAGDRAEFGP